MSEQGTIVEAVAPLRVPHFSELPVLEGTSEHHSWGVFGTEDQLGSLNFITPDRVRDAARLITSGVRVGLNLPLGTPKRLVWAGERRTLEHHIVGDGRSRDDYLDAFFLQGSTQWDALSHRGYRQFGFYGGRDEEDLARGDLGIDRLAEHGVFGRGILLDIAGYVRAAGDAIDPRARRAIDWMLLEEVAHAQRLTIAPGDILLLHTGWLSWYLGLDDAELEVLADSFAADHTSLDWPGLHPGKETAAWLWDHRIAAIAADNPTVEVIRYLPTEGYSHHRLLALLGMPLGELWALEELATVCAEFDRYEFFLASAPLNLPRGVGSPANAYAIF